MPSSHPRMHPASAVKKSITTEAERQKTIGGPYVSRMGFSLPRGNLFDRHLRLDLAYDQVFVRSTWTIACFHEKYKLSACYQDMYLDIRTHIGSPLGILASFAFHQCEQISLVILGLEGSSY
ncbi:hypothetical protein JTB14_035530 [Gonioctena quinquepunctata]|nr:hypothetical protein JTB14_035530 [Gonioctena quinquepunctata]